MKFILYLISFTSLIGSIMFSIYLPVFENIDFDDDEMFIVLMVFIISLCFLTLLNIIYKSYYFLRFKRILLEMDEKKKIELEKINKLKENAKK